MSPLQIKIILHYCAVPAMYDGPELGSSAFMEYLGWFIDSGMIRCIDDNPGARAHYEVTPKGLAYVQALMDIPEPECVWVCK